jgi:hypothetical protein
VLARRRPGGAAVYEGAFHYWLTRGPRRELLASIATDSMDDHDTWLTPWRRYRVSLRIRPCLQHYEEELFAICWIRKLALRPSVRMRRCSSRRQQCKGQRRPCVQRAAKLDPPPPRQLATLNGAARGRGLTVQSVSTMTWPIAAKSALPADVGRHARPTVRRGCGSAKRLGELDLVICKHRAAG